ncbi:hypothetical protein H7K33_01065 [Mycobacterium paraense]|uniref:hypothetical protein n=1 Tax=Mycobacterium paraense TaxID=767916 RepID=UPI000A24329E|nr:hypothetical protein [Mycobacterium paraense]MCV7440811.1 hypothetical protein [Mycobacterium paraense]ORW35278.1 hypothetical protein AWB89_03850 [Mycobacterium paraense]
MVQANTQQLTPGAIASELFCLDPDRDERAPQLCAEALLTLVANEYRPCPADELKSPKRQRFAIRSLALGTNFLGGRNDGHAGDDETSPAEYGARLAKGDEIRGSSHLRLAQQMLQGLVDPDTQRGQPGAWLLRPFHESLLWYDARKESPNRSEYTVRKVYMRGSGITLARLLVDPVDPVAAQLGQAAVTAIRDALTSLSPLAEISAKLEDVLPRRQPYTSTPTLQDDERDAWTRGADPRLQELAERLCRHAEGIMLQAGASPPSRLWQLRTIFAIDLALHVVRTAWVTTRTPQSDQFLLLSFGDSPRSIDPIRQRSEESYRRARIRLSEATVQTLARRMRELSGGVANWAAQFQTGSALGNSNDPDSIANQLSRLSDTATDEDYLRIARAAVEVANYSRGAEDGFRVLLESTGALVGTGQYRFLTAGPDLLAGLVGALSAQMPMSSREFFAAVRQEWGLIINQESAADTSLVSQLDGAGLERNARRAEKLMNDAGLALGLSDRTTMVGERAARVTS